MTCYNAVPRLTDGTLLSGQGCFEDNPNSRDLPYRQTMTSVTPQTCVEECSRNGYTYAGVQVLYSNE